MTVIKKELHDLIEGTTDEQLLNAIKVILTTQGAVISKLPASKKGVLTTKKMVLPNGREIFVTPGDPNMDTAELFGIWKDNPEILNTLRASAWGGRA